MSRSGPASADEGEEIKEYWFENEQFQHDDFTPNFANNTIDSVRPKFTGRNISRFDTVGIFSLTLCEKQGLYNKFTKISPEINDEIIRVIRLVPM